MFLSKFWPVINFEGEGNGGSGGTGDGGGSGGNPPAGGNAVWHEGMDAELLGHAQTHGWANLDGPAAAKAALTAHYNAKKLMGVPPDQLLRWPKDANDTEGWNNLYSRLGVPKEAKDYDFSTVLRANNQPLDEALVGALRKAAFTQHLPKEQAIGMAKAVAEHLDAVATREASEKTAKLQAERDTLKTNWAQAPEAFMVLAKSAAARLGVTPEEITALEGTIGYARVMEMFKTIGEKIGEHPYLVPPGGGGGPMSREQAVARKAELKNDKDWVSKYLAGGAEQKREMAALDAIIVG